MLAASEEPTIEVDPVLDQTRAMAIQMFAADLSAGKGLVRDPMGARIHWIAASSRRGDEGMVRIIEALDVPTFDATWNTLMRTLDQRGLAATLEWLRNRETR